MKILKRIQFGDPILRNITKTLTKVEIMAPEVQRLIADMRHTLLEKKLGVGLAAPQIGKSIALSVIAVRPTEYRPDVKEFDLVLINPRITEYFGRKVQLWEGCISAGSNGKADLFAKVPRHKKITVQYNDEKGTLQKQTFDGLMAQVIQHETDHLNGILFVDHVKDTKTYMTYKQYVKLIQGNEK